jgi:hypothetical protein
MDTPTGTQFSFLGDFLVDASSTPLTVTLNLYTLSISDAMQPMLYATDGLSAWRQVEATWEPATGSLTAVVRSGERYALVLMPTAPPIDPPAIRP